MNSLVHALSERPKQAERSIRTADRAPLPVLRVRHNLHDEEIGEMVAEYRTGDTLRQVAARHGISRARVSSLFEDRGVDRRGRSLTAAQVSTAQDLYLAGNSLATVGLSLGVDGATIRSALLRQGVSMRGTHGELLDSVARN